MPLRRAFSSLGCPEFTLEETLALAARHGLAGVELRALGGSLDLPAHLAARYGTPAALAEKLRGAPVRVAALDASLPLAGAGAAERAALLNFVPWAEALGVRWLRVFDGAAADAAGLERAAETVRWWRGERARHGWQADLMVETHDALFTAAAVERFLAAAPGTKILWDAHHTWKRGGEDPAAAWPRLRPHVVHVHVKDSVARPSARHPFTYVLPGDGGFPMAGLVAALRADGFGGLVSLEWEKLWHPYLPPLEDALRTAAERNWW